MSADEHYDDHGARHIDGSTVFLNREDMEIEDAIARDLAKMFRCGIQRFAPLSPVDFYAVRDGRPVGIIEVRSRSIRSDQFETVFLGCRKWLSIEMLALSMNVPGVYAVNFLDGLRWIGTNDLTGWRTAMGGNKSNAGRGFHHEPVFHVPIERMKTG